MRYSNPCTLFQDCLPTSLHQNALERTGYEPLPTSGPDSAMFEDALHNNLDHVVPCCIYARARMNKVKGVLQEKLKPTGQHPQGAPGADASVATYKTSFSNIFAHGDLASPDSQYSVRLKTGQIVKRSREEVERHILFQSHLRSARGDASIGDSEVLSIDDVLHPITARLQPEVSAAPLGSQEVPIETSAVPTVAPDTESSSTAPVSIPGAMPGSSTHMDLIPPVPALMTRLPAVTATSTATAIEPLERVVHDRDTAVPLAVAYTPAQEQALQFIEERLNSTHLDFFDAVSRMDPVIAAFFAIQTAKMTTATGAAVPADEKWGPSRHPLVDLEKSGEDPCLQGHKVKFRDPAMRDESDLATSLRSDLLLALLMDLRAEIARQNQLVHAAGGVLPWIREAVLPFGASTPTTPGEFNTPPRSPVRSTSADPERLADVLDHATASEPKDDPISAIEQIASNNPEAAAAYGLIDHLLTIQGPSPENCVERYHYASDVHTMLDFSALTQDRRWLPTFIPGVQRRRNCSGGAPDAYRANVGGSWREGCSRANVFGVVGAEALRHLQATEKLAADQAIFPLRLYALLADAAGLRIPEYLKAHEQEVLARIEENRIHKKENAERIAALQKATAEEKPLTQAVLRQLHFDLKVNRPLQVSLIDHGLDDEKLQSGSIERSFTLVPKNGNPLEFLRHLQENNLASSHLRQSISSRSPGNNNKDNKCWLRSSWIPLLSALDPEELSIRYLHMYKNPEAPELERAERLRVIAQEFKEDPPGFLHAEGAGATWQEQTGRGARLGKPVLQQNDADITHQSTESFLEHMQIDIASAFRSRENPSLMNELERIHFFGEQATSDLPVLLHQAFNIPLLVIEAGQPTTASTGDPSALTPQIRVAAPTGSDLAALIDDAAKENLPVHERSAVLEKILKVFLEKPIIWLERGHFEVYIPNHQFM
jgi:hypothetical protein